MPASSRRPRGRRCTATRRVRHPKSFPLRGSEGPPELIFDSRLTTYAKLDELDRRGIRFITLRRRSAGLLREIALEPPSAWRRVELRNAARAYRTPRVLTGRSFCPATGARCGRSR